MTSIPKGTPKMATRNPPTTETSIDTQLPDPHWMVLWPSLERDHDPEHLVTNDPAETERTTLERFGVDCPETPTRQAVPMDTRDRTTQTSVFAFPCPWWDDADRLEALFDERDLEIVEISDLLGDEICYDTVRSRLKDFGIRDPADNPSLTDRLDALSPEDAGLSPMTGDDYSHLSKRGERA